MSEEKFKKFTPEEASVIANKIGMDLSIYSLEEFIIGLTVEHEHGAHDPETNVTNDDELITGKIAWAHMKELPDYYTRLEKMEEEAEKEMKGKGIIWPPVQ